MVIWIITPVHAIAFITRHCILYSNWLRTWTKCICCIDRIVHVSSVVLVTCRISFAIQCHVHQMPMLQPSCRVHVSSTCGFVINRAFVAVERARVLFPYKAENADELTLEEGQIIIILDKVSTWFGWTVARWTDHHHSRKGEHVTWLNCRSKDR